MIAVQWGLVFYVAVLPHSSLERLTWALVAVSVGFCEEVVYRGYFRTQFATITGRVAPAIGLQALLFGIAHAEQGGGTVLRFAIVGVVFGAIAQWRRSLWPTIACHVAIDLVGGLAQR